MGNKIAIIQTLLTSPQGGPEHCDRPLKILHKKWVTLLCCLNRLEAEQETCIKPPREVIAIIFGYCLPKPKDFINHVPLLRPPKYKPFMCPAYKAQIITELVRRHANKHKHVLSTKVNFKKTCFTPKQMAMHRGFMLATTLLDHKALGNLKQEIIEGYVRLME